MIRWESLDTCTSNQLLPAARTLEHELEQPSIHDTSTRRFTATHSFDIDAGDGDNAGTLTGVGKLFPATNLLKHVIF